jgi:hypothetical protein
VTGQVTFGDLLGVARWHLDQAGRGPWLRGGRDLPDVAMAMHVLALAIGSCLRADSRHDGCVEDQSAESASRWLAALARARGAAFLAARQVRPPLPTGRAAARASERGRHVEAAARAVAAGRDLLGTHMASDTRGTCAGRSVWAPAVRSPEVGRGVAAEMGQLARQAAGVGEAVAGVPAGSGELGNARQDLAAACRYLRLLAAVVRDAQHQEPVLADDRELMRAIPAGSMPARRLPDGSEPVGALCAGVIAAAERVGSRPGQPLTGPAGLRQ